MMTIMRTMNLNYDYDDNDASDDDDDDDYTGNHSYIFMIITFVLTIGCVESTASCRTVAG